MEAVLLYPTHPDQSISPNNHQNRNRKKSIHQDSFVSRSSENFAPTYHSNIHGGLGLGGSGGGGFYFSPQLPNLSSSFSSSSVPFFNNNQPPLLPLPITRPYSSLPVRNTNNKSVVPFSPNNNRKNNNRIRDQDHPLKPKKFRSQSISPKKQNNSPKQDSTSITTTKKETLVISPTKRLGPEPSDLPKGVSRVLKPLASSTTTTFTASAIAMEGLEEEFSGSIFSLAPPPSSLPLPKFSLKPKLVPCNVEAGGIDDGATDNLRRLLRLR
ncbi:hypothetical protein BVC80_9053g12 [Macleaya cordata]|uniref:Uncharacterized protein n=1 Tax=Macleaya cordata TaxID=56857 RepID=A0A200RA66_MACCD|nr:hypothetical protein BVC80_9053g12 [Macleaya cordata]